MNKKKILSIIVIAAFAAVMAFNVNLGSSKNSLADIALTNIEALAKTDDVVITCDRDGGQCWGEDYFGCYWTGKMEDWCNGK